jgi:hypothetical protein
VAGEPSFHAHFPATKILPVVCWNRSMPRGFKFVDASRTISIADCVFAIDSLRPVRPGKDPSFAGLTLRAGGLCCFRLPGFSGPGPGAGRFGQLTVIIDPQPTPYRPRQPTRSSRLNVDAHSGHHPRACERSHGAGSEDACSNVQSAATAAGSYMPQSPKSVTRSSNRPQLQRQRSNKPRRTMRASCGRQPTVRYRPSKRSAPLLAASRKLPRSLRPQGAATQEIWPRCGSDR